MAKFALYVALKAKPGKAADVEAFLKQGAELAKAETGTVTWYGIKEGEGSYAVFDTFHDEAGRDAHLSGNIAKALRTCFVVRIVRVNRWPAQRRMWKTPQAFPRVVRRQCRHHSMAKTSIRVGDTRNAHVMNNDEAPGIVWLQGPAILEERQGGMK